MLRKACVGFPDWKPVACKNIVALSHARDEHYLSDLTTTKRGVSPPNFAGVTSPSVDHVAQWTHGWHYDNIRRLTRDSTSIRDDGWPLRSNNTRSNIRPAIVARLISLSRRVRKKECNKAALPNFWRRGNLSRAICRSTNLPGQQ